MFYFRSQYDNRRAGPESVRFTQWCRESENLTQQGPSGAYVFEKQQLLFGMNIAHNLHEGLEGAQTLSRVIEENGYVN